MRLLFVLLASAGFMSQAHAGYASVPKPVDWSQQLGKSFYKTPANDVIVGNTVRTNTLLNVGGRNVTMPSIMRFSANAGRIASRGAFLNPWLLGGAVVGAAGMAAYEAFKEDGFKIEDGIWKKKEVQGGCADGVCYEFAMRTRWSTDQEATGWFSSASAACSAAMAGGSQAWTGSVSGEVCFGGPEWDPQAVQWGINKRAKAGEAPLENWVTVPQQQFEDYWADRPIPQDLPKVLPDPLPVEDVPILNPSAMPNGNPAHDAGIFSQPMRVPSGKPVLVPNTDPPEWEQPFVDIVPDPVEGDPWRVDLQPKVKRSTDGQSLPDTAPVPISQPGGTPTPNANEKPGTFETCGLPGSPACKIDESGTPQAESATKYDSKLEPYVAKRTEDLAKIGGTTDKPFFQGWNVFFSAPAVVECAPITLPDFGGQSMGAINPCGTVNGVRYVMGYIWALAGLWLCMGMIKRAV